MGNNTEALTEFLLARVEEEEATFSASYREVTGHNPSAEFDSNDEPWASGRRWIRECEAKRRIMELHTEGGHRFCPTCDDTVDDTRIPCPTVRILAAVYADHPDYREEWKP